MVRVKKAFFSQPRTTTATTTATTATTTTTAAAAAAAATRHRARPRRAQRHGPYFGGAGERVGGLLSMFCMYCVLLFLCIVLSRPSRGVSCEPKGTDSLGGERVVGAACSHPLRVFLHAVQIFVHRPIPPVPDRVLRPLGGREVGCISCFGLEVFRFW